MSTLTLRIPRLRLAAELSPAMLLDGGWWPRSTDPVTELPGLVLALDIVLDGHDRVIHVILARAGWDSQPRRVAVVGRMVSLAWFASQPRGLLTASGCGSTRIDLLVVPSDTDPRFAEAAMTAAADPTNTAHTPAILAAMNRP
jgi:hypothetical protein